MRPNIGEESANWNSDEFHCFGPPQSCQTLRFLWMHVFRTHLNELISRRALNRPSTHFRATYVFLKCVCDYSNSIHSTGGGDPPVLSIALVGHVVGNSFKLIFILEGMSPHHHPPKPQPCTCATNEICNAQFEMQCGCCIGRATSACGWAQYNLIPL